MLIITKFLFVILKISFWWNRLDPQIKSDFSGSAHNYSDMFQFRGFNNTVQSIDYREHTSAGRRNSLYPSWESTKAMDEIKDFRDDFEDWNGGYQRLKTLRTSKSRVLSVMFYHLNWKRLIFSTMDSDFLFSDHELHFFLGVYLRIKS